MLYCLHGAMSIVQKFFSVCMNTVFCAVSAVQQCSMLCYICHAVSPMLYAMQYAVQYLVQCLLYRTCLKVCAFVQCQLCSVCAVSVQCMLCSMLCTIHYAKCCPVPTMQNVVHHNVQCLLCSTYMKCLLMLCSICCAGCCAVSVVQYPLQCAVHGLLCTMLCSVCYAVSAMQYAVQYSVQSAGVA